MENNGSSKSEVSTEDVTLLLSKAQTILEGQVLFGHYIYQEKNRVTNYELGVTNEDKNSEAPLLRGQPSSAGNSSAPLKKELPKAEDLPQKLEPWQNSLSLPLLYDAIHNCMECPLGATRTKFVFGSGNPDADIMIIGEAPGADEDAQGLPFVGAAGQLLTKILAAIGISREEVYIANILKCRPPGNRTPEKSETDKCEPYLWKQIELIKPRFILAVGLTAANTLLKTSNKMGEIRGKTFDYHGATMLITYHPAALLRNPNWKTAAWEDVKLLRRMYDDWQEGRV